MVNIIVIGEGLKDAQTSVMITSGHCENVVALMSDHEEADCTAHYSKRPGRELWFRTGVQDKLRYSQLITLTRTSYVQCADWVTRLTWCD